MDKMKKGLYKKSIKAAFIGYMAGCIMTALLFSLVLSNMYQMLQSRLYEPYQKQYQYGYVEEELDDGHVIRYYTQNYHSYMTPFEQWLDEVLNFMSIGTYPLCFVVCIVLTSILFYKKQLQGPLRVLEDAAEQIAQDNLNFKVICQKENELGQLCVSFEKMRTALKESKEEMWRQIEERKHLNAAFSHDLRTPLTVLKGQSELLKEYAKQMSVQKITDTSEMMYRHIERLEVYVKTMQHLQRLEDIEIIRQRISLKTLQMQIKEMGAAICREKQFIYHVAQDPESIVYADSGIMLQVMDNLLSNASRFARSQVEVCLQCEEEYLYLTVKDDGKGFTAADLESATNPFYKTANETEHEHLGMGLNICKVLTEKHGGYIRLSNQGGAQVLAAFKII